MTRIGLIVLLLGVPLAGGEVEVRAYRVAWPILEKAAKAKAGDDEGASSESEDLSMPLLREPGFRSRFLDQGAQLWDCRQLVEAVLGPAGGVKSAYDPEGGRLVVQADEDQHEILARLLEVQMRWSFQFDLSLARLPPGGGGKRPYLSTGDPEGAKELASITFTAEPGKEFLEQWPGGHFKVRGTAVNWRDKIVDAQWDVMMRAEGIELEFQSDLTLVPGFTALQELGRVDGKDPLALVLKTKILIDGGPADDWILKEKGGVFLRDRRHDAFYQEPGEFNLDDAKTVTRLIQVPPIFVSFLGLSLPEGLSNDEPLPELPHYQGDDPEIKRWDQLGYFDCRSFFEGNGVEFREGDFAMLKKDDLILLAKAGEGQMLLLEAVIRHVDGFVRTLLQVELAEVVDGRTMRSFQTLAVPGAKAGIKIGNELEISIEGQVGFSREDLELRVLISGEEKVGQTLLNSSLFPESGVPVIVQESRVDGERRAWVLTAWIVDLGQEASEILKAKGQ